MTSTVTKLICVHCGRDYRATDPWTTCADCGPHDGILDIQYDMDRVRAAWREEPLENRPHSHWRYRELLPLDPDAIPSQLPVGWTPIVAASRLAQELGIGALLLKDEGRNPTASLKDRASSVGVAHAREQGAKTIACASTGNAATSLAGQAAHLGMQAMIFVPPKVSEPKLAQLLIYGAAVFAVNGSYEDAYRLCSEACQQFGWYNRNCAINPVLVEGKKTAGLEIAEQCGQTGEMPNWISVGVGDGCTIAGIWKGLVQMHELGVIDRLPRMLGVQAADVAPVCYALEHSALPEPRDTSTIADGIDVQVPRNWRKAVRALQESSGTVVRVSDEQILEAMQLAGCHGIFGEPAAAAAVAGIITAVDSGIIGKEDRVLGVITGSGLKDTQSAIRAARGPVKIEPNMDALNEALRELGESGEAN